MAFVSLCLPLFACCFPLMLRTLTPFFVNSAAVVRGRTIGTWGVVKGYLSGRPSVNPHGTLDGALVRTLARQVYYPRRRHS